MVPLIFPVAMAGGCAAYDSGLVSVSSDGGGAGGGKFDVGGSSSGGGMVNGGGGAGSSSVGGGAGSSSVGGGAGDGGSGGSAGNAGDAQGGDQGAGGDRALTCGEHPLTPKTNWTATASQMSRGTGPDDVLYNPPSQMTDDNYAERWSSGIAQSGNEWIQLDFGAVVALNSITLNVNTHTTDFPRGYELRVSNEPKDFDAAVITTGEGMPGNTVLSFDLVTGRYATVRQTGVAQDGSWWSVAEVFVACTDP